MDLALDPVVLAVADLDAGSADWAALLARVLSWRGAHPALGTYNTLFSLETGYLELLAASPDGGLLAGLVRSSIRRPRA